MRLTILQLLLLATGFSFMVFCIPTDNNKYILVSTIFFIASSLVAVIDIIITSLRGEL